MIKKGASEVKVDSVDSIESLELNKQESQTLFEQYVAFARDEKQSKDKGRVSIEALQGSDQHRLIHRLEDGKIIFDGLIVPGTSQISHLDTDDRKGIKVDLGVIDVNTENHMNYTCNIQFLE